MSKIKNIQHRATQFIYKYPGLSYKEHPLELNLLPLNYWLEYLNIVYFFKGKLGLIDLKRNDLYEFCSEHSRHQVPLVFFSKIWKLKPHPIEIPFL